MASSEPKRRVLVAEDDADIAALLLDFLSEVGFSVLPAEDGADALQIASAMHFDVLLTDLQMPHLDGRMLIRLLRQADPMMPVVVMTGQPPPDWRFVLQQSGEGPLMLLVKPVPLQTLHQTLLASLEEARAGGRLSA